MSYRSVWGTELNWQTKKKEERHCPRWNNNVEVSHVNKVYHFWELSLEGSGVLIEISRNLLVLSKLSESGQKQSLCIMSGQYISKDALS